MPTIRAGDRLPLGLDVGKVLTVTCDAVSSAIVRTYPSNTQGIQANGSTAVAAGTSVSFGPYLVASRFQVECLVGTVDYVIGEDAPESALEKPIVGTTAAQAAFTSLVSGAGKKVAFFGDSFTNSAGQATLYGFRITGTVNGFTSSNWVILQADPETPAGTGNWVYDATARTCTWAAPGESAGPAIDVSRTGVFYLPSSVAGHGLTVVMDGSLTTYSSGTTTVTVPADGNQYQAMFASRGYAICALMQAGPSWDFARTTVYPYGIALGGVPGLGASSLAASTWQTNSIRPDVDVIEIGTNDVAGSRTAAAIIADMTTFIQSRIALGTRNIGVFTIPPRSGGAAFTANQLKVRNEVNRWIKDYCASIKGLYCLDIAAAVTDPATGVWVSGYGAADGIHPANIGAWSMGKVVSNWLLSLAPSTPFLPDFNDIYDATYSPYGAWVAGTGYLSFEGSGGTAGAGASGTVPANYTMQRAAGTITGVGSKVARTDNVAGNWLQIAITGGGAGEYMRLDPQSNSIALSALGAAAGDKIEGFCEVNIPASVGMKICNMLLSWGGVAAGSRGVHAFSDAVIGSNAVLTDSMGKFWLRLPPTTVPVGATSVGINFRMGADTSATVQLGRWWVSKVRPL